ncbi:MAG: DUF6651 domain-containing protein [Pseudomonas helleri]|uniref:DUF6651 domain-containing protein n=1 Tax=Pseudomonas helleri TaxID=1608996 RepID=UPI0006548587|nr:DUF6651 domain-containing protein [Pseudomonas helleri]KMN06756.1 hypothetical protein TU84_19320 [Pseudomonas helleri]
MKLKLDEQGHVVVQEGKPVYTHDDGKDVPFDAPSAVSKITALNSEAKGHREAKEAAEARAKAFEGIEDPEKARAALATVANLDAGQLVQAGKVEEIKAAAIAATEEKFKAQVSTLTDQVKAVTAERDTTTGILYQEKIGGAFGRSKFVSDKIAVPPDMLQNTFGKAFKVEDGKVVAYGDDGNKIYSRTRPGELADFDEALESLVERYPHRENILKSSGATGGGAKGGGNGGGAKSLPRAAFDALDPAAKAAHARSGGTVTD